MRSSTCLTLLLAAIGWLLPADAFADPCTCQPDDIKRLGLLDAIAEGSGPRFKAAMGVLGSGRGDKPVEFCTAQACPPVKVRVVQTSTGCEAWLDYCRLCVKKANATIVFRLADSQGQWLRPQDGFTFSVDPRGIEIDGADSGDHFKNPRRESNKLRYAWRAGARNTDSLAAAGLPHRAHVVGPGGQACTPKDPIIVNVAN